METKEQFLMGLDDLSHLEPGHIIKEHDGTFWSVVSRLKRRNIIEIEPYGDKGCEIRVISWLPHEGIFDLTHLIVSTVRSIKPLHFRIVEPGEPLPQ